MCIVSVAILIQVSMAGNCREKSGVIEVIVLVYISGISARSPDQELATIQLALFPTPFCVWRCGSIHAAVSLSSGTVHLRDGD